MFYLKDNKTDKRYKLTILNIIELTVVPTLSLIIYGFIFAILFSIIGLPVTISLILLVLAYAGNLLLIITKRISPSQLICSFIIISLMYPIIKDIVMADLKKNTSASEQITVLVNACTTLEHNKPNIIHLKNISTT